MDTFTVLGLATTFFAAAMLYASVGHGGASAYLAIMALFGLMPEVMRPTALTLNILVSLIAAIKFARAGFFSWSTFWPFAVTSVPFAFLGGSLLLPASIYRPVVGVVLLYAAFRMIYVKRNAASRPIPFTIPLAITAGSGIGFLSGLTGVGGGIFLSPLLLLMGWADAKRVASVSAVFVLVNSIAALAGHVANVTMLPRQTFIWAAAAGIGGWIGARYGAERFSSTVIQRLLAIVLTVAGLKMLLS